MDLSNLLTPWLVLAVVLAPLVYAEKWIHSHLYGVGWLLTNEPRSATALYYVILFPGVFLHEFVQWLVAGALNVETERVMAWPEAQEDGTLRLDFVQAKDAGRISAAVISAAPLIVGLAIIWFISNRVLDLEAFLSALNAGDVTVIGPAVRDLASTPDFYLWLYLMFTVTNAMLPTPMDRRGWPLVLGLFGVVLLFLVLIGVGDVLLETFTGPVAHGVNLLTAAFGTVLAVEVGGIVLIGMFEEVLERLTGRKFDYSPEEPESFTREPGSNLPLPAGEPFPSIYNLDLPIPDPSIQTELDARKRRKPTPEPSGRPVATPGASRPREAERPAAAFGRTAPRQQPESAPSPTGSRPQRSPVTPAAQERGTRPSSPGAAPTERDQAPQRSPGSLFTRPGDRTREPQRAPGSRPAPTTDVRGEPPRTSPARPTPSGSRPASPSRSPFARPQTDDARRTPASPSGPPRRLPGDRPSEGRRAPTPPADEPDSPAHPSPLRGISRPRPASAGAPPSSSGRPLRPADRLRKPVGADDVEDDTGVDDAEDDVEYVDFDDL